MQNYFFIGSLPHSDPKQAIAFVKKHAQALPFLPQLPEANPFEDMIQQVLLGFDRGYWAEEESCAIELFFETFKNAPRLKIQVAGPYTMSRVLSLPYQDIEYRWILFWKSFAAKVSEKYSGELWLQVDEPSWGGGEANGFPESYPAFLASLRGARRRTKVGLHTCARPRPTWNSRLFSLCDFISMDFSVEAPTQEEIKQWETFWSEGGATQLIVGAGAASSEARRLLKEKRAWQSAPCGLAGWSEAEMAQEFDQGNPA